MLRVITVAALFLRWFGSASPAIADEGELVGAPAPAGGIALASWSGGHVDGLIETAGSVGCDVRSVWLNRPGGGLVGYFPTPLVAPNRDFLATYPGGTLLEVPVIVVCATPSTATPPLADCEPWPNEILDVLAVLSTPDTLCLRRYQGAEDAPPGLDPRNQYSDQFMAGTVFIFESDRGNTFSGEIGTLMHEVCHAHQHRAAQDAGFTLVRDWLQTPSGMDFLTATG